MKSPAPESYVVIEPILVVTRVSDGIIVKIYEVLAVKLVSVVPTRSTVKISTEFY